MKIPRQTRSGRCNVQYSIGIRISISTNTVYSDGIPLAAGALALLGTIPKRTGALCMCALGLGDLTDVRSVF
jgi:hypothetical protein